MNDYIREGIKKIAVIWFAPDGLASRTMPNDRTFEGDVLTLLDKNNVYQVEEKALPKDTSNTRQCFSIRGESHAFDTGYFAAQQDMLKAGWK